MVERLPRVLKVLGLFPSKAKQNHKPALPLDTQRKSPDFSLLGTGL